MPEPPEQFSVAEQFLREIPMSDLEVLELLDHDPDTKTFQVVLHDS